MSCFERDARNVERYVDGVGDNSPPPLYNTMVNLASLSTAPWRECMRHPMGDKAKGFCGYGWAEREVRVKVVKTLVTSP